MPVLSSSNFNKKGSNRFVFANYPSAKIYKKSTGSAWKNHLLFGDYITLNKDLTILNGRVKATSRGSSGWVKVSEISKKRILEVNFVDIGQGDGCHVVTPDDQHLIIDAGRGDNMYRYLSWRYNLLKKKRPISIPFTAIVSHSDSDHYQGFSKIFSAGKIVFDKIYHNCIVERPGESNPLGAVNDKKVLSLIKKDVDMKVLLKDPDKRKGSNSLYLKTMYKVFKASPEVEFIGISSSDNYLPKYNINHKIDGKSFVVEILAPIIKKEGNVEYLPFYKDVGKTKNGHSIILKLQYDKIKILLGGDLNEFAGKDIVNHYDKLDRNKLIVDIAKACHHGSNHFYYKTLERFNSLATVISSGDDESYSHPRPDTMGAIGKCGFGSKPLIFSTEMARSNKEITNSSIANLIENISTIKSLKKRIVELKKIQPPEDAQLDIIKKKLYKAEKNYNSALTKFGMINVRTDGQKGIIAQKLEKKSSYSKWDIYEIEYDKALKRFKLVE